jgi:hypothetical protein
MAGVRGFSDPNVQVNPDGLPVWYQSVYHKGYKDGGDGLLIPIKTSRLRHVQQDHDPLAMVSGISGRRLAPGHPVYGRRGQRL